MSPPSTPITIASTARSTPRFVRRVLRIESRRKLKNAGWGVLFAMPWLIGLLVFVLGPIIACLLMSFTDYTVGGTPRWIGVDNYGKAFTQDELFWPSLARTFEYSAFVVPLGLVGSLCLALLLNQGLRGTNLFRTLYFLPHLTPAVAMAILWKWLLQPSVGPVNYLLSLLGIEGPGWFADIKWALPSIALVNLWAFLGGNHMLIFLAGLQGVPQELYDAADVDGAGRWRKFSSVTLPMISPTVFFNLIMGVIGSLKVFALAYVATEGGPSWATWFYALHIYKQTFQYFELGYGATLAWIFAIILITMTAAQFWIAGRWVYYAGEDR